jgi:hypothetical protein
MSLSSKLKGWENIFEIYPFARGIPALNFQFIS